MERKDVRPVADLCKYERIPFLEFGEDEYNYFVEKCMLNEELSKILYMLIHNKSIIEIADALNMSDRTVSRRINLLKRKIKKVI